MNAYHNPNKVKVESVEWSQEPIGGNIDSAFLPAKELPKPDSAHAADILQRSADLLKERGKQYDTADGRSSMDRAVTAFNAITGHTLTEADGWLLMQMVKDARQWAKQGYHADSAEDCISFAALKAVAKRSQEQER